MLSRQQHVIIAAIKKTVTDKLNHSSAHTNGDVSPFTSPVNGILHIYFHMKNAFVNDNDKAAAGAGNEMVKVLNAFDKSILRDDERKQFEDLAANVKEHAKQIGLTAGNIKRQREHFELLSKDIYVMAKKFAAGERIYANYCPMFNDNKGAVWLSETEEIKNPYFGSKMLTCGNIAEILN